MELWSVVRVSSAGQDTEGQIPANQRWADANGRTITKTVPIKASAFKPGSALDKHIDAIIAAKPDGVVLRRVDRLSRRGIERGLATLRRFREADVKLFLADMGDAAEVNEMALSGMLYGAYVESKAKSDRTFDNHMVIAGRGAWMSTPPFGYHVANSGTLNARLAVCEAEARIVREIFRRCKRGDSIRDIEAWSASLNYVRPTPKGEQPSRPWRACNAQVVKILNREAYATGETELSSTPRDRDGNPVESQRLTWVHKHPAIVDRELYDAATAAKNSRRNRADYSRDNTLVALESAMLCSKCSGSVKLYLATQRKQGRTYERYQCRKGHGMQRAKAENLVGEMMHGHIEVSGVNVTSDREDPREAELTAMRAELSRANAATDEGFNRIVELRHQIGALEAGAHDSGQREPQHQIYVDATHYATASWAERRELVRTVGIRI